MTYRDQLVLGKEYSQANPDYSTDRYIVQLDSPSHLCVQLASDDWAVPSDQLGALISLDGLDCAGQHTYTVADSYWTGGLISFVTDDEVPAGTYKVVLQFTVTCLSYSITVSSIIISKSYLTDN